MRILIVDDEKSVAAFLAAVVQRCNHEVIAIAGSGLDAIRFYREMKPDAVLMDYRMSKLNGLTACRNILGSDPFAQIILVSGMMGSEDLASTGAVALLQKPIRIEKLAALLESLDQRASHRFPPAVEEQAPSSPATDTQDRHPESTYV